MIIYLNLIGRSNKRSSEFRCMLCHIVSVANKMDLHTCCFAAAGAIVSIDFIIRLIDKASRTEQQYTIINICNIPGVIWVNKG
jgi:hypothetical protein